MFVFFPQGKNRKQEVYCGVTRSAGCSLKCVGEAEKGHQSKSKSGSCELNIMRGSAAVDFLDALMFYSIYILRCQHGPSVKR